MLLADPVVVHHVHGGLDDNHPAHLLVGDGEAPRIVHENAFNQAVGGAAHPVETLLHVVPTAGLLRLRPPRQQHQPRHPLRPSSSCPPSFRHRSKPAASMCAIFPSPRCRTSRKFSYFQLFSDFHGVEKLARIFSTVWKKTAGIFHGVKTQTAGAGVRRRRKRTPPVSE
jgi:hypothetical protein